MSDAPVIRIVRKKVVEAHHGGSWKVAYADFVTAMMAFFLVMWVISMDQSTREIIQNYFNDPASASNSPAGISKLAGGGKSAVSTGSPGAMPGRFWGQLAREAQKERLDLLRRSLQKQIAGRPDLSRLQEHVAIDFAPSGLAIELIESREALFFESGAAQLSPEARALLGIVARELGRVANPVVIEGHTDAVPYAGRASYSNWELSADRANAARRAMVALGLRPNQVVEVRGYADSQLRHPDQPKAAANRRVSIRVNFVPAADDEDEEDAEGSDDVRPPFSLGIRPK